VRTIPEGLHLNLVLDTGLRRNLAYVLLVQESSYEFAVGLAAQLGRDAVEDPLCFFVVHPADYARRTRAPIADRTPSLSTARSATERYCLKRYRQMVTHRCFR